MFKD
jgi:hypothetical protein